LALILNFDTVLKRQSSESTAGYDRRWIG